MAMPDNQYGTGWAPPVVREMKESCRELSREECQARLTTPRMLIKVSDLFGEKASTLKGHEAFVPLISYQVSSGRVIDVQHASSPVAHGGAIRGTPLGICVQETGPVYAPLMNSMSHGKGNLAVTIRVMAPAGDSMVVIREEDFTKATVTYTHPLRLASGNYCIFAIQYVAHGVQCILYDKDFVKQGSTTWMFNYATGAPPGED